MSHGNVDAIKRLYERFAEGDVPSVLAMFDPEIVWNEAEHFPYADRNPYIGPQAVLEGLFMRLGSEWHYWKVSTDELLDAGDTVVALGRYRAKNKATEIELDAQFVHVWKLREGRIVCFQQYADTYQAMNAVGGQ